MHTGPVLALALTPLTLTALGSDIPCIFLTAGGGRARAGCRGDVMEVSRVGGPWRISEEYRPSKGLPNSHRKNAYVPGGW